jgi:hypothetical protein
MPIDADETRSAHASQSILIREIRVKKPFAPYKM